MFFKPKIDFSLFVGKCVYFAINAPSCASVISTMAELMGNRELLHERKLFRNVPGDIFDKIWKSNLTGLITKEEKERFDSEVLYFRLLVIDSELIKLNRRLNLGYADKEILMCLVLALEAVYEKMSQPGEAKRKTENLLKKFEVMSGKFEQKPNELILKKFGEGYYFQEIFTKIISPDAWNYGTGKAVGQKYLFINQLSTFVYYNMKDFCDTQVKEYKILKRPSV